MSVPRFIIPVLVVAVLYSGFALRSAFTRPTTAVKIGAGEGKKLECVVAGVKCKGTARFFTSLYEGAAGITGIETYATEHRVIFNYDPGVITPDRIRAIMEAPVLLNDGRTAQVFKCLSLHEE